LDAAPQQIIARWQDLLEYLQGLDRTLQADDLPRGVSA